jgi:hypothetical protein
MFNIAQCDYLLPWVGSSVSPNNVFGSLRERKGHGEPFKREEVEAVIRPRTRTETLDQRALFRQEGRLAISHK